MQSEKRKLSASELWGKLTIYLREHNNIILHIICGELRDVEYDNDVFVIYANDYTADMLTENRNYSELKKAFEFFDVKQFEIRKQKKALSVEENIQILNKYFDNQTKIIK